METTTLVKMISGEEIIVQLPVNEVLMYVRAGKINSVPGVTKTDSKPVYVSVQNIELIYQ